MQKTCPTLYIIDGSAFLYRAFYALKPMSTSTGISVQAVYGFCRMLKKLIDDVSPEYLALVWDAKGPTVRHERYEQYKATRQAPPSDLFTQKELIRRIAHELGIFQQEISGYEADDIMASLARMYTMQGFQVVLVSSDKDMGQLVSDQVRMYDTFTQQYTGPDQIEAKYGFQPARLPFYFALVGDASDNVPGVAGIGPKGAAQLVRQFADLDDMYAHIERIASARTVALLESSREAAYLSYDLVQLQYPELSGDPASLRYNPESWLKLKGIFTELEFKSLLKDFPDQTGAIAQGEPGPILTLEHTIVRTHDQLVELAHTILQAGHVAIDTETNGAGLGSMELVGISCAVAEGHAWYIPLAHEEAGNAHAADVRAVLQPILDDARIKKYLHNAKFDMHALACGGFTLTYVHTDTLVAAGLLRKEGEKIGLKSLSWNLFSERMQTYSEVVSGAYSTFAQVPIQQGAPYAAADAHQTLKLVPLLLAELDATHQRTLFDTIEMPTMHILQAMEARGIIGDPAVLAELDKKLTADIQRVLATFHDLLGDQFTDINLNSPAQLKDLLFVHLGLRPVKKTSKGTYSTDQEVLEELAKQHPIPALIISYRELSKLHNTYIKGLLQAIHPDTTRIYTSFNQTQTATGRLSSSDPNLQNIPVVQSDELSIRDAFKPTPGYIFIAADYSQIELRVVAYLSQDSALLATLQAGADIHAHTASKIFDVPLPEVTSEQRQVGKRINFSILYGLTPYGLSKDLGISLSQAKQYIDKYYAEYPGLVAWMDEVVRFAHDHGYVKTHWGRRRAVPGIYEKNKNLYEAARRVAINTVAQGTAADLMKLGMIKLDQAFKQRGLDAHMVLHIHDELLIEAPIAQREAVRALVHEVLEHVVDWNVALTVNSAYGDTWGQASR